MGITAEWVEFLASQSGRVSEAVQAEIQAFRSFVLDEAFKAENCRHCPHCGLAAIRELGCAAMTCGSDAQDKGGQVRANLGCRKQFDWDSARRYKALVPDPDMYARSRLSRSAGSNTKKEKKEKETKKTTGDGREDDDAGDDDGGGDKEEEDEQGEEEEEA